jgi:hypothetical protein
LSGKEYALSVALDDLDVADVGRMHRRAQLGQHAGRDVERPHLAAFADEAAGDQRVRSRPGADVEDLVSGPNHSGAEWIAHAGEGGERLRRESIQLRVGVTHCPGARSADRKMERMRRGKRNLRIHRLHGRGDLVL